MSSISVEVSHFLFVYKIYRQALFKYTVFFLPTCSKLEGERDRTLLANRNQLQILGISFHIENNELC